MPRVLVKGGSGSGKTTLARALSQRLGVPHVELDALHHGAHWQPASAEQLRRSLLAALDDTRGWVVDGNYDSKLGSLLLDRAELIVWLDLPLSTKLRRVLGRTLRRWWLQEELWNGNRENLRTALWGREALLPWTVSSHFRQRRAWPERLAGRTVTRLRTRREVADWLERFERR